MPDHNPFEWALPAAGLTALVVLALSGCLNRSAMDAGPDRRTGLGAADLAVAFALWLVGAVCAQSALNYLGLLPHADSAPDHALTQSQAWAMLAAVVTSQLPVVAYFAWRVSHLPTGWKRAGLVPTRPIRDVAAGLVGFVPAVAMAMGVGVVAGMISEKLLGLPVPNVGHEMLEQLVEADSAGTTIALLLAAIVAAPLLEEIIFRGLVQSTLSDALGPRRRWTVVLVASAVFTLIHFNVPWQAQPSLFILGIVLGWLYERTGSLLPSMIVHAGFNGLNVALALAQSGSTA